MCIFKFLFNMLQQHNIHVHVYQYINHRRTNTVVSVVAHLRGHSELNNINDQHEQLNTFRIYTQQQNENCVASRDRQNEEKNYSLNLCCIVSCPQRIKKTRLLPSYPLITILIQRLHRSSQAQSKVLHTSIKDGRINQNICALQYKCLL